MAQGKVALQITLEKFSLPWAVKYTKASYVVMHRSFQHHWVSSATFQLLDINAI